MGNESETNDKQGRKLPLKILKPLVKWMKRKLDKMLPSKFEALMSRWEETKDWSHLSFESFLKETLIFTAYRKELGRQLTMDVVKAQLSNNPPANNEQCKAPVYLPIEHHGGEKDDKMTATAV